MPETYPVKFVWANGKLAWDWAAYTHHTTLWQKIIDEGGDPNPQNYIAGWIYLGINGDVRTVSAYDQGKHPSLNEIYFMVSQELAKYDEPTQREAAGVEDTEPEFNFGFLDDPHPTLYPCAWEDMRMRQECTNALKAHVFNVIEGSGGLAHAAQWIYFTVYGSGASFNWDETGDFDIQMWVSIDKYNEQHPDNPMVGDDLLAMVRRAVQSVNFPSFKQLNLQTKDCAGDMLIQFYPKLGSGTPEENEAQKPYACWDMEKDEWIVRPKPYTADFYGEHFLMVSAKANDIADQAGSLIEQYQRNILSWQFWNSMNTKYDNEAYEKEADKAKINATIEQQGIGVLFKGVFGGRQEAYSPEGEGIDDERDATQKLLEVWGVFQQLKHFARVPLPWDSQEMPENPDKESSVRLAVKYDFKYWRKVGLPMSGCFGYVNNNLVLGETHHQLIMAKFIDAGWTWEQLMNAPQAWGWFSVNEINGTQPSGKDAWGYPTYPVVGANIGVQFTSDSGTQILDEVERAKGAFASLYHLPAELNYSEIIGIKDKQDYEGNPKEYGSGLKGKDFIDKYFDNYKHMLDNIGTPPPPPDSDQDRFYDVQYIVTDSGEEGYMKVRAINDDQAYLKVKMMFAPREVDIVGAKSIPQELSTQPERYLSSIKKFADWSDITQKAQRIRQDGGVTITVNAPDHVVGEVVGDHDTYNTEIWRDDPQSQAITMWDCTCPWSQYSWGRTRQWKKYEGRPCAHTLALFWQAQGTPPTGGSPQAPPTPVPGGGMIPQQGQGLITPVDQQPLITPIPLVTDQAGPIQQGPAMVDQAPTPTTTPGTPTSAPTPTTSIPIEYGQEGPVGIPGALSHWKESSGDWSDDSWKEIKVALFQNGDIVRTKYEITGDEPVSGEPYSIAPNTSGEVIYSDSIETFVIFPLSGGILSPHVIKVEGLTNEFYMDQDSQPFVKKRRNR